MRRGLRLSVYATARVRVVFVGVAAAILSTNRGHPPAQHAGLAWAPNEIVWCSGVTEPPA